MIVVLLGTNPYSFDRLVNAVDRYAAAHGDEIFVQLGNTKSMPKHCAAEHFIYHAALAEKIRQAELVICHGGFGSIRDALAYGKPVISVPRRPELNECNDYQEELVRQLEEEGRIIAVYDIADLETSIEKARNFQPNDGSISKIPEIIGAFLRHHVMPQSCDSN